MCVFNCAATPKNGGSPLTQTSQTLLNWSLVSPARTQQLETKREGPHARDPTGTSHKYCESFRIMNCLRWLWEMHLSNRVFTKYHPGDRQTSSIRICMFQFDSNYSNMMDPHHGFTKEICSATVASFDQVLSQISRKKCATFATLAFNYTDWLQ